MRRLFTARKALSAGVTRAQLKWGERTGAWRVVERGVYAMGAEAPTRFERAVALVLATGGVASGTLAAVLLRLDSIVLRAPYVTVAPTASARRVGVRRRALSPERIITVKGIRCTDGLQTLLDLAPLFDDLAWEQVLESALRKKLVTIAALERALKQPRIPGATRMRRVLALRPPGAAPTESLLETLMVQLARTVPDLPPPVRQLVVHNRHGVFAGRVDLAWPELGLFIELDGQQHRGQPVYDASRETAVIAATGWFCGRSTWTEVVHHPQHTVRRLGELVAQARRRPMPAE